MPISKENDSASEIFSTSEISIKDKWQHERDKGRNYAAYAVICVGLVMIFVIIMFGHLIQAQDLRTGAWTLFASIVGAAVYHVFGMRVEKD